jgi:hypothetical protein
MVSRCRAAVWLIGGRLLTVSCIGVAFDRWSSIGFVFVLARRLFVMFVLVLARRLFVYRRFL